MLPWEPIIALVAVGSGLFTWSHNQRQQVLNSRFSDLCQRLTRVEEDIEEIPKVYATKEDVSSGMADIKNWLARIDQKLDKVILRENG